jgi:tetratricopeptide (TPR) repeat protein
MECGAFKDPQGLYIRGDLLYICDSGNNRIVVVKALENAKYEVSEIIEGVTIEGEFSPLNYPMDVFVTPENDIYVADTRNGRVLRLDAQRNFVSAINKPEDETFTETAEFLPFKLVVDVAGRVFLQAQNVNKGFMEFDINGDFIGYMGANRVNPSALELIWRALSTRAQRAQQDLFIPTEYSNLAVDEEGFIYATNTSNYADSVRRLNAMGNDILIRNGIEAPMGDLAVGTAAGISGNSKFIDVTALENDCYACFDRTRGRIFVYDFQGNLLYAFAGLGNREGYFTMPTALDHMGMSLFALDSRTGAVTRMDLTDYGKLVNDALLEYKKGHYDNSSELWEQVLKRNGNYDLAYIGIGRAALRQNDYKKAMEYFKLKRNSAQYGKAFQLYRKEWMETNLWWILVIAAVLIATPALYRRIKRVWKEVQES